PNIFAIEGDVRDEENLERAIELAGGRFDVVLSDMAPKITGIKDVDRMASAGCAELALWAAGQLLRPGGGFVVKVFKSNEAQEFFRSARPAFETLVRCELKSTRKTSTEFYIVGTGFRGIEQAE